MCTERWLLEREKKKKKNLPHRGLEPASVTPGFSVRRSTSYQLSCPSHRRGLACCYKKRMYPPNLVGVGGGMVDVAVIREKSTCPSNPAVFFVCGFLFVCCYFLLISFFLSFFGGGGGEGVVLFVFLLLLLLLFFLGGGG